MSDKLLIAELYSNSESAFRKIFDMHYQGLIHYAYAYVRDEEFSENIVQESFILLWNKRHDLSEAHNIHGMLVQTVKNKALNHILKLKRRREIEEQIYDEAVREMELDLLSLDTMNTINIEDINNIVRDTLSEMSQQTQDIFNLSRLHELSHDEIASKFGLTTKSIEYHITKSLSRLRVALNSYLQVVFLYLFSLF